MENNHIIKRGPGRPRVKNNLTEEEYARRNQRQKDLVARRKEQLMLRLGGVCEVTGSHGDLEFHHCRPSTKEFNLCGATGVRFRWERVVAEADKCVLLCAPVHKMIHAEVSRIMQKIRKGTELTPQAERALIDYHTHRETRRTIWLGRVLRATGMSRYLIIKMLREYYE